jgi:hypothetical protein
VNDVRARLADALRVELEYLDKYLGEQISSVVHISWWAGKFANTLLSLPGIEIAQWRDIPDFPGYRVSDSGVVQSFKFTTPKYLNATLALGYPTVSLTAGDGVTRHVRVHVAVMRSFVGPPPDRMEVRHLDGDPLNCRLENLAYGTSSENKHDTVRHGKQHNASKTVCPKGHPYSGANLILARKTSGATYYRICRECKNQDSQRRYRRKRATLLAAAAAAEAGAS